MLSLGEYQNGETGDSWLVMSRIKGDVADGRPRRVRPVALMLSRSGNVMSVIAERIGWSMYPDGVPMAFWVYRNQMWASNGFQSQVFDGHGWSADNNDRTDIAARTGGVAEGKMFMANTPTYPDELTWADRLIDLPVTTKWTGTAAGGGTGVAVPLWGIAAPGSTYGLFAAGGAGTLIRSLNDGLSWYGLPYVTVSTLRSVALLLHTTDQLDGWIVGPSYLSGETRYQNVWHIAYDDPTAEPSIEREVIGGLLEVYASVIDQEYVGEADPWKYAIMGGGGSATGKADIRQWNGSSWIAGIYNTHTNAQVRDIVVVYDGTDYHRYACGTYDDAGNALMVRKGGAVATLWYDADGAGGHLEAFPDLTASSVNLYGIHGFGTGNQHTFFTVGGIGGTGYLYRYRSDGTPKWSKLVMPGEYTGYMPQGVLMISRTVAYVVGERGLIMKSIDAGGATPTWTVQTSGVSVQLNRIINYDADDTDKLCVIGDGGVFLVTSDGGTTWDLVGQGEFDPNKMNNAIRIGAGESIRAKYQRSGMLSLFTNRGIRVFETAGMTRQFDLDGFETFNDNCIGEFRGMIVMLGKMDGVYGIYGWDGSASPPRLLSESVNGIFAPSPGNKYIPCLRCIPDTSDHIWATEDDFRPREEGMDSGMAFNGNYWTYDNGLLVMRILPSSAASTVVLSHGITVTGEEPDEVDTTGIFVPNVTDWGYLSFDYTLNHPADEGKVSVKVEVRTAPDVVAANGIHEPGNWTGWGHVRYLPHTGQGALLGRGTLRIELEDADPDNKWLQWQLVCRNFATSDFNVVINRVIVRAYTDTDDNDYTLSPAPPCLVVYDDAVFAHFSVDTVDGSPRYVPRCVVLAGKELQVSSILTGGEIACARVIGDDLFLGMFGRDISGEPVPKLLFVPDDSAASAAEHIAIAQELRFYVDFSGADARARAMPKDLRAAAMSARPVVYRGSTALTLRWAADDIVNLPSSGTALTFHAVYDPANSKWRDHVIDIAAAVASANSSGRRFHCVITGSVPFILEAFRVSALVRPADWPTITTG